MPRIIVQSEFFLDLPEWQVLRERTLPEALARHPALRVWSAGCHSGKEPFSLAILLDEMGAGRSHYLLATDISDDLLARAQAGGPFAATDVGHVTAEQRARYFRPGGPPFYVTDALRGGVTFRRHDLASDPYEGDFDVILFRDVEPFLSGPVKAAVQERLSAALRSGGSLFIGSTDTLPAWREWGFRKVSRSIYANADGQLSS